MGRALTRGESATKRQRAAFKALGLDAGKVAKSMQKNAVGTTLEVMEALSKVEKHRQNSLMSDLFGDEARALAPMLNELDLLRDALKLVATEEAYANSVGKEFERRAATAEYAMQRFKSQLNDVALSIGGALIPAMKQVMETLGPVVLRFAQFAEAHPTLIRNVVLAASALVSLRVAAAALSWVGLQAKGAILQVAAAALAATGGMWRFTASLAGFVVAPVIAGFNALRTAMIGYAAAASVAGHGTALAMMGRSLLSLLNPLRLVTAAMHLLKVAVIGNPIGIALAAIAAAGTFIYNNWNGIAAMFSGVADGFAKGLGPAAKFLEPVATFTKKIWDAVSGLLGPLEATEAQWRAWGETIGGTVAGAVNAVANGIGRLVGLFTSAIEGAYAFGRAVKSWTGWGGGGDAPAAPAPAISGARAKGGPIWPGGSFIVGEEGPEIITPTKHGYVHPNGSGVGGAGGMTFSPAVNVTNHFHGINDFNEIMRKIDHALADGVRSTLRAVQADYGFKFT